MTSFRPEICFLCHEEVSRHYLGRFRVDSGGERLIGLPLYSFFWITSDMQATQHAQQILVVDDQPINLKLLQRKLEREGYEVVTAMTGLECLEAIEQARPDLILLDVMMPEMDGIETCQRLKADTKTSDIPVIFITAKSSKAGKLEGLDAGAADYITKPIDLDETLARVRTQLRIQEVYRINLELQKRLGDARKSAAIGGITQGIAHNLNNLLGVVVGYLDLLKSGLDSPDMVHRSVDLMDQAIQRMVGIIRHLSTIATNERVPLSVYPLEELLATSIERFRDDYGDDMPEILLDVHTAPEQKLSANLEVFEGLMSKLLINAYESYDSETPNTKKFLQIEVLPCPTGKAILLKVHDKGSGLDASIAEDAFEPFITTKTSVGRGLGLTIARHAIRSITGELDLSPHPSGGTTATLHYPLRPRYLSDPVEPKGLQQRKPIA